MEFEEIMAGLSKEMEESVNKELTIFYRMSGVMVQMLMFDAEQKKTTLQADVRYMENYKALEEMKDFETLEGISVQKGNFLNPVGLGKKGGLPSLGSAMMQQQMVT